MSKQIPTFLFIKTFHPPGFSLVLWPPFEVHQAWKRCVSVSVSLCVSKGKIKSRFSPCCTASSSPVIPTQHSNTSEAGSTSEEALGLSTAGKVNHWTRLPAHLDGIIATSRSRNAAPCTHHCTRSGCATPTIAHRHSVCHMEGFKSLYNQWAELIPNGHLRWYGNLLDKEQSKKVWGFLVYCGRLMRLSVEAGHV